jgi:hypothetical protein
VHEERDGIGQNYLQSAIRLFKYTKTLGEKAVSQVSGNDIHWRPDEESNSIAIIFKHMSGNMLSRWTDFLTTDGEKEWRDRDTEFVDNIKDMDSLLSIWEKGWNSLFSALEGLTYEDLGKIVYIRNEGHTVLEAIDRQLAHYAYHVGQVVYIAKSIRAESWKTLSVPKGKSRQFNEAKFKMRRRRKYST